MTEAGKSPTPAVRGHEYRGKRAASNTLVVLGGQFLVLAISLFTTRLTLQKVGGVEFAIWTLATLTINYLTILDPGFGDIVARYGAQARVRGETKVAARICTLGSLVWIGFGVLLAPFVVLTVPYFLHHVKHLNPGVAEVAIPFFYWTFAILIFGSILSTLSGRLVAMGEQWVATVIDSISRVLYAVTLLIAFESGWRLSAIVLATAIQYLFSYLATFAIVAKRDGFPYASPRHIDRDMRRQLYRAGGLLQLNSILDTLTFETDPPIIAFALPQGLGRNGPMFVWSLAQRLGRLTTYFANAAQSSVLPGISAAYVTQEGRDGVKRIYLRASRFIVFIGAFLAGAFMAFGPLMFRAWLGRPYFTASTATILVVLTMFAGLPRQITGNAILAIGKVGLGTRAQVLAFFVNLVLTLSLVWPFGLTGVLTGTVVAKVAATGYLLVRFSRAMESSLRELVFPWLVPILIVTAVSTLAGRLELHFWPSALVTEGSAIGALLSLGLGYAIVFVIALRVTHYFSRGDLEWLRDSAPRRLGRLMSPKVISLVGGHES